jgi:nucleoside phosphorylase
MGKRKDTMLVVAHELELSGLPPELSRTATVAGVGLPDATARVATALAERRPPAVILLGSYGRYPQPRRPLQAEVELLVPDEVRLLDVATASGDAAFPQPMRTGVATDPNLSRSLRRASSAHGGGLATTLAITTDDGVAFRLAASGLEGENLEALGVAIACQAAGVPFAALLGCTNEVGANGREQWARNHEAAAHATARALLAWLDG